MAVKLPLFVGNFCLIVADYMETQGDRPNRYCQTQYRVLFALNFTEFSFDSKSVKNSLRHRTKYANYYLNRLK